MPKDNEKEKQTKTTSIPDEEGTKKLKTAANAVVAAGRISKLIKTPVGEPAFAAKSVAPILGRQATLITKDGARKKREELQELRSEREELNTQLDTVIFVLS